MPDQLTLVIGNKNYSSWSLRAWLALKQTGIPFQEIVIPLYQADSKARILAHSPSGKVPVLIDGNVRVWESLSICEYVAERFPEARLWPADREPRSHARSISAEMHAGFTAMRQSITVSIRAKRPQSWFPEPVRRDIVRATDILGDCRKRYADRGPYLFGDFSIADAMFAPVLYRFRTYAVAVPEPVAAYMAAVLRMPALLEWEKGAHQEVETIPQFD